VAGFTAISATGKTIERLLNAAFEVDRPHPTKSAKAVLVRTDDFAKHGPSTTLSSTGAALSIFLYKVDIDPITRAGWAAVGSVDGRSHLPLDLHYLLTAWSDGAEFEQRILGSAMSCLDTTPILSGPLLHPSADWQPNEAVQIGPEELGTDNLMRIFDSLEASYRASLPYRARVVRIDSTVATPSPPVTDVIVGAAPELDG
jgi:Pvc16 N-terminal domain